VNKPLSLAACTLACLAFSACSNDADTTGADPARPNVLLIVVDTLRADHLGAYGNERPTSPNLDALAASGVRYGQALSTAPWTTPSIAALMTSRYPSSVGIESEKARLSDEALLLAEVLQEAGYLTGAAVSHSFCGSEWGFGQGFDGFDESNVLGHAAVTTDGVTARGMSFLDEAAEQDQPWMLWLHYFDPHCAYVEDERHPMGGRGDYDGKVQSGELYRKVLRQWRRYDESDWNEMRRLYDSEIARTDQGIGELLAHLDRLGLTDNTLVVMTADHGEEFHEHGGVGHAKTLYREVLHVPLIVRYPRSDARFAAAQPAAPEGWVSLVDVAPTVLDVCQLEQPQPFVGLSLLHERRTDRPHYVFGETHRAGGLRTVVADDFKLIRWLDPRRTNLFDLSADPEESKDLSRNPLHKARLGSMNAALDAHLERVTLSALKAVPIELDAEAEERLGDMGYAGSDEDDED
jgi:arylsulfatase A-like enzyme